MIQAPPRKGKFTPRHPLSLSLPADIDELLDLHCGDVTSIRALPKGRSIMLVLMCKRKSKVSPASSFGFGFGIGFGTPPDETAPICDSKRSTDLGDEDRLGGGGGGDGGGGSGSVGCQSQLPQNPRADSKRKRRPRPPSSSSSSSSSPLSPSLAFKRYRLQPDNASGNHARAPDVPNRPRRQRDFADRTRAATVITNKPSAAKVRSAGTATTSTTTTTETTARSQIRKLTKIVSRKLRRQKRRRPPSTAAPLERVLEVSQLEISGKEEEDSGEGLPPGGGGEGGGHDGAEERELCSPARSDNSEDIITGGCDVVGPDRTDHKYDVYICYESSDLQTAMTFRDDLRANGLECFCGEDDVQHGTQTLQSICDAMLLSRKIVLLLSRHFLQCGIATFELAMSLNEMYDRQKAHVVPVLLDRMEVPPCLRHLSLVDYCQDPNYVAKLLKILKGPDISVNQLMPAGNVASGLAWSYYFYLRIILKDIARRVDDFCKGEDCKDVRMPRKLFILVPASCFCPPSLENADKSGRVTFGGHLAPIWRDTAGSVGRLYKQTVWNIRKASGQTIQFVGEYCNVAHTMYEMDQKQIAGLDTYQLRKQRDQFFELLDSILKQYNHSSQASLVFVQDTDKEGHQRALSEVLEPVMERERLPPAS